MHDFWLITASEREGRLSEIIEGADKRLTGVTRDKTQANLAEAAMSIAGSGVDAIVFDSIGVQGHFVRSAIETIRATNDKIEIILIVDADAACGDSTVEAAVQRGVYTIIRDDGRLKDELTRALDTRHTYLRAMSWISGDPSFETPKPKKIKRVKKVKKTKVPSAAPAEREKLKTAAPKKTVQKPKKTNKTSSSATSQILMRVGVAVVVVAFIAGVLAAFMFRDSLFAPREKKAATKEEIVSVPSVEETETVKVTFMVNGEIYQEYDADVGSLLTDPRAPEMTGKMFLSWEAEAESGKASWDFDSEQVPGRPLTLTAVYEDIVVIEEKPVTPKPKKAKTVKATPAAPSKATTKATPKPKKAKKKTMEVIIVD